jgi:2-polyprenyl-3-methyl-5-hydroxy-6-metoxy-1,4-benzoquinol methylase
MHDNPATLTHISLQLTGQESDLRRSLYETLVRAVCDLPHPSNTRLRVLDIGVGRGELLQRLSARGHCSYGLDQEAGCVAAASRFGECAIGSFDDAPHIFGPAKFDVIVCSHVLEHLDDPGAALEQMRRAGAGSYVFAVPNPLRPIRILKALIGSRRPDHPEHVNAWAHPEFAALLRRCGFRIDSWYADRVTVNPFRGSFGAVLTRLLHPIETMLLPHVFPMMSSSLIVRCSTEVPQS